MKQTILMSLAALALVGTSPARTWTSSDGSKTFEGDFVSSDGTSVTVKRGFKELTFKLELLSEEDRKWAKEEAVKVNASAENKKATAKFAESEFGKAFKKMQKLKGKRFAKHELAEAPKFFLLYIAASW